MILKELLKKENELWKKENDSTGIIANKKTYAEIISGKTQKPKRIPRIIIKKTKTEEKIEKNNDDITHYLTKEKTIQTVYTKRQKRKQQLIVVVKKVPIKHMTS